MTITELKAHAYDCIIQLEKWQLELRGINNEIKKLEQLEKSNEPEGKKEVT